MRLAMLQFNFIYSKSFDECNIGNAFNNEKTFTLRFMENKYHFAHLVPLTVKHFSEQAAKFTYIQNDPKL